jgi:hypothetical protein
MRYVYNILVGKSEGKRPLRRHRHRWEDNIIMDLREMCGKVWTGFNWLRMGIRGRLL